MMSAPSRIISIAVVFAALFSMFTYSGCSKTPDQSETDQQTTPVTIKPEVWQRLSELDITPDFLALFVASPDGNLIALALDSVIRIQPGDEMWSEDLPSDWYGMRNHQLLYIYDIAADRLELIDECDQIVNFYYESSSQPVDSERWQGFASIAWSPDGSRILLVKDQQESQDRKMQNALVYVLGTLEPVYLDLFTYWQELVKKTPESNITNLVEASWIDAKTVRIVLATTGGEVSLDMAFSAETGELISTE